MSIATFQSYSLRIPFVSSSFQNEENTSGIQVDNDLTEKRFKTDGKDKMEEEIGG
ncbi:MAG: hypothetical protein RSC80_07995 [Odoribacter sp.]